MTILQRSSGVVNTATTPWTITPPAGNFGTGTTIAIGILSNTVFTAGTWSQRASSATAMGIWVFDRIGAGEASIPITASPAGTGVWFCWEMSAGSTFLDAAAQQFEATSLTVITNALTPSAGARHLLAAAGGNGALTRSITGWSNSFVQGANHAGGHATSADFSFGGAADRDVVANGSTAYDTTATINQNTSTRGALIAAYTGTAADVTPPSVPTGLATSLITSTGATLTWNAATDDTGVTGYEVQIIGP